MIKLFFKDTFEGVEKTYEDLFSDLSNSVTYNKFCKSDSFYEVFKQIIQSLIIGEEIILLDSDFADNEIIKLVGVEYKNNKNKRYNKTVILQFSDIQEKILINKKKWKITLFTSGTTGVPKKISHSFDSISRSVKKEEKRGDDIWGFAYNPTHMAGLQVFFQAFMNQNTIIRLFGLQRKDILTQINENIVTNISATPTFYRLLLPADQICSSVNMLTSGGEKFDSNTLNSLKVMFPNSKIRNVYASTEAGSLFSSNGDVFTIKSEISKFIKVEDNEIFLHRSLMGNSSGIKFNRDWYATGDLIEVIKDEPLTFKFISRRNEMINTGGYKVNPTEVEETLRLNKMIKEVYVYGKKNSLLGNIVCCEIVRLSDSLNEKMVRDFLSDKLQEYKIPRVVKFVDILATTRTGKLKRK